MRTLDRTDAAPAIRELARALAFWAGRSLAAPDVRRPAGTLDAHTALAVLPRAPQQRGPVRERFGQLAELAPWSDAVADLRPAQTDADVPSRLAEITTAAACAYLHSGGDSPVLLVHTATAPNAVLAVLPVLPTELWQPSLDAVWSLTAAITSAYASRRPVPPAETGDVPDVASVLERAALHGDEHVVKFTDCAVDSYARSGDARTLAAAARITELIAPPS